MTKHKTFFGKKCSAEVTSQTAPQKDTDIQHTMYELQSGFPAWKVDTIPSLAKRARLFDQSQAVEAAPLGAGF